MLSPSFWFSFFFLSYLLAGGIFPLKCPSCHPLLDAFKVVRTLHQAQGAYLALALEKGWSVSQDSCAIQAYVLGSTVSLCAAKWQAGDSGKTSLLDRPSVSGRALSRGGKEVPLSQQLGNPPQRRCAQLCYGALRRPATRLPAISSE